MRSLKCHGWGVGWSNNVSRWRLHVGDEGGIRWPRVISGILAAAPPRFAPLHLNLFLSDQSKKSLHIFGWRREGRRWLSGSLRIQEIMQVFRIQFIQVVIRTLLCIVFIVEEAYIVKFFADGQFTKGESFQVEMFLYSEVFARYQPPYVPRFVGKSSLSELYGETDKSIWRWPFLVTTIMHGT